MCNRVRETANNSPYCRSSTLHGIIAVLSVFILMIPLTTMANGAAGTSGFTGNEVIILEKNAFNQFIVDENVNLDFTSHRVRIKYDIENASSSTQLFKMVFPIESTLTGYSQKCETLSSSLGAKSWKELVDFKVSLNNVQIEVKPQENSSILPEGEYKKLLTRDDRTTCTFMTFDLRINPGKNSLLIDYHLIPDWFRGDGVGERWTYIYSIWPAKNWVSKFRNATWRVVIPQYRRDLEYQFDNWYVRKRKTDARRDWYKWELTVTGPGTRKETADYIEFTAANYVPTSELTIRYALHDFYYLVESAYRETSHGNDKYELWIESYLRVHPFIGDKMCYQFEDLRTGAAYMGFGFDPEHLPYVRNEIYARRGYIFKSEQLNNFFSKQPWYVPMNREVKLNEFEEWNVKFISEVEKSAKTWNPDSDDMYGGELEKHVMKKRTPCPEKGEINHNQRVE